MLNETAWGWGFSFFVRYVYSSISHIFQHRPVPPWRWLCHDTTDRTRDSRPPSVDEARRISRPHSHSPDMSWSNGSEHQCVCGLQIARTCRSRLHDIGCSVALVPDNIAHSHVLPPVSRQCRSEIGIQWHTPCSGGTHCCTSVWHGTLGPHLLDKLLDTTCECTAHMAIACQPHIRVGSGRCRRLSLWASCQAHRIGNM